MLICVSVCLFTYLCLSVVFLCPSVCLYLRVYLSVCPFVYVILVFFIVEKVLFVYFLCSDYDIGFFLENIRKVVSETYMLIKSKLPSTLQSMSLFLANKDTEYILFKPVKVS